MFIFESYIFIGATEPQQSQKKNSLYATIFKFDCSPSFDRIRYFLIL